MLRWQIPMIKECSEKSEIIFVLENLRKEDKEELVALYGDDWKIKTLNDLENKKFLVLYGKDNYSNIVPIAIGGFYECFNGDKSIACAWLLSSSYIKINKSIFLKEFKNQLLFAEEKYEIMFNFIHRTNFNAKKWLAKFGFKFDNPKPKNIPVQDGFEFFYKVNKKGN